MKALCVFVFSSRPFHCAAYILDRIVESRVDRVFMVPHALVYIKLTTCLFHMDAYISAGHSGGDNAIRIPGSCATRYFI